MAGRSRRRGTAAGEASLVHAACVDDDAHGEPVPVLWKYELDARVIECAACRRVGSLLMIPELFAPHHTSEWSQIRDRLADHHSGPGSRAEIRPSAVSDGNAAQRPPNSFFRAQDLEFGVCAIRRPSPPRYESQKSGPHSRELSSKLSLPIDPSAPLGVNTLQCRQPSRK
jgi:hypothetical protein